MSITRTFGRFMVHPDKILVRIWPITGMDNRIGLWLPPSAQRRESTFRWGRILQVGERVKERFVDEFCVGDVVLCKKFVDAVFGMEGKFKLAGKYVCVTMPTELLIRVEFEDTDADNEHIPPSIKESVFNNAGEVIRI
jgi:hypothetical protein